MARRTTKTQEIETPSAKKDAAPATSASDGKADSDIGTSMPAPDQKGEAVAKAAAKAEATDTQPAAERASSAPPTSAAGNGAGEDSAASAPAPDANDVVLRVIGPRKGRWRAGLKFTREPRFLIIDDLTLEQAEQLRCDPTLSCTLVSLADMHEELGTTPEE